MAPKRPSPLEEPPSASETEEEEEELNGSEEEDEEEEEEEEPPTPIQSSLKNPNPNKTSLPKPQSPSSSTSDDDSDDENADLPQDDDSDSEDDDSDSDNEPVKHMIAHRNADVKPISSKPMLDAPKSKKPAPAAAATPAPTKATAKRPLEGDNTDKKSKKKKVSEFDEDDDSEKKTGDDRKLFQRIWSDEDEIIILNGLIDFKKKGYNVSSNMGAFFDFIKDSLHVDVSKSQLNNKLQRLKQKYQNNANRAKPGEDPVISRPHEVKSYRLSKEIWGEHTGKVDGLEASQVTSDSGNPDVKKTKKPVNTNNIASPKQKLSIASPKQKLSTLPDDKAPKVEAKEADSGSGLEYHYLNQSLKFRNDPMMPVPPLDLGEIVAKKGWDSVKSLDATSLNKRWKEVMIAETKAYLARLDLVREQTKLMLDELQSSDS